MGGTTRSVIALTNKWILTKIERHGNVKSDHQCHTRYPLPQCKFINFVVFYKKWAVPLFLSFLLREFWFCRFGSAEPNRVANNLKAVSAVAGRRRDPKFGAETCGHTRRLIGACPFLSVYCWLS
jgi:hypothetical protein